MDRKVGFFLLLMLFPFPTLYGAGSCSSLQPQGSCSPSCDSSCNYYTFTNQTSSQTVSEIPYQLSALTPGGEYCDLEGEDKITQTMSEIPFVIGPNNITQLPWTINLAYKKPVRNTRTGPPCPPPPPPPPPPDPDHGGGGSDGEGSTW